MDRRPLARLSRAAFASMTATAKTQRNVAIPLARRPKAADKASLQKKERAMADEIEITAVRPYAEGGDAASIEVRYGAKKATINLVPGEFFAGMTNHSWRDELRALATALVHAPITDKSSS